MIGRNVLQARYSVPQQQELKIDTLRAVVGNKGELASEFTSELLAKGCGEGR